MNQNKKLLDILWEIVILTNPLKFNHKDLSQLAQACLHAKANSIELKSMPTSLHDMVEKTVWLHDIVSSRWQNKCSELLQEVGFEHEREVSPCNDGSYGNMLLIDFVCKDKKIAIELDGPSHFLTSLKEVISSKHSKENGPTIAKRRLLNRLGWKIININYMDFAELNSSRSLQKDYLKQELRKIGFF